MALQSANRQIFNPTALKHRQFDAHISTAKNCGTHWIKYMLGLALAEIYDLPPPAHIRDDSIVGHTRHPPVYKNIPQIAVTHSHPHYLMRIPAVYDVLDLPRFVVLVRDIRAILVSIYEKAQGDHLDAKTGRAGTDFSSYLRGDVTGRTRIEDIWGLIRYFNAWGPVVAARPDRVMVVRYEDLVADTQSVMKKICAYLPIEGITDDILARAIAGASRDKMREKLDTSEDRYDKSVNESVRDIAAWYNKDDMDFLRSTLAKHLKCGFGYEY